jgi:hypothetical protein
MGAGGDNGGQPAHARAGRAECAWCGRRGRTRTFIAAATPWHRRCCCTRDGKSRPTPAAAPMSTARTPRAPDPDTTAHWMDRTGRCTAGRPPVAPLATGPPTPVSTDRPVAVGGAVGGTDAAGTKAPPSTVGSQAHSRPGPSGPESPSAGDATPPPLPLASAAGPLPTNPMPACGAGDGWDMRSSEAAAVSGPPAATHTHHTCRKGRLSHMHYTQ